MEVIKRKIDLEKSTDRSTKKHWGELTATTFYINILITQTIDDMGLFTDQEFISKISKNDTPPNYSILINKLNQIGAQFPFMNGATTPYFNTITTPQNLWDILRFPLNYVDSYYNYTKTVITGLTESRIEDIRSYDISEPFKVNFDMNKESYDNYEGDTILGVDRLISYGEPKVYVFDASDDSDLGTANQKTGFYFEDYKTERVVIIDGEKDRINKTVIRYVGEGSNETNTSLSAITKEEYLFGKIFPPEVQNDVFIERTKNSVLDIHLRLSEIRNIKGLEKYGNGFYKVNKQ